MSGPQQTCLLHRVDRCCTETVDPLEFLARLVTHIPNTHQVMTRYDGWYANRPRGTPPSPMFMPA